MSGTGTTLLRVDLSRETTERVAVPAEWLRQYVGGKGLGARYLYGALSPGADPLGPENVVLFLTGPLAGELPGESRYAVVTKSPVTGCFLDSYAGGRFPARLAGALGEHRGLVVTGAAAEPVRVVVADGTARVEPATTWGADTAETAASFPDGAVACIGPAGEHRVAAATVASDGGDHHAGRGGAGAVLGSKRLKAVVARGEPPAPDPALVPLRERTAERFRESDTGRWLDAGGTVESVDFADAVGALATRGWTATRFEGADDIGVEAIADRAIDRETGPGGVARGFRVGTDSTVPRGATGMSLGAGLGIDDADAVTALGGVCDRLGLDLIGAGGAVAWAVRAADAGVLEPDRELAFGDAAAARRLLRELATRESDLGDALADGVAAAAERFGGADLVPTVKGLVAPNYDPRGAPSMALAYATSDRGACHRRAMPVEREAFEGPWSPERAARAVARAQTRRSAWWCLVADDFLGRTLADDGAAWLDVLDPAPRGDPTALGERVWTLTRLFNVREGVTRADDTLPAAMTRPLPDGPDAARAVDPVRFEAMLDAYYARREWGPEGRPTRGLVERCGLDAAVDDATPLATTAADGP
jgi:aldehyde:ferredoxin oxidoreductase